MTSFSNKDLCNSVVKILLLLSESPQKIQKNLGMNEMAMPCRRHLQNLNPVLVSYQLQISLPKKYGLIGTKGFSFFSTTLAIDLKNTFLFISIVYIFPPFEIEIGLAFLMCM